MNIPGFLTQASLPNERSYRRPPSSVDVEPGGVVPAQVVCGTVSARCNGPFGSRTTGFTSTTVVDGISFSCGGGWQYAWTTVCRDLATGATTSRTNGCGFCLF